VGCSPLALLELEDEELDEDELTDEEELDEELGVELEELEELETPELEEDGVELDEVVELELVEEEAVEVFTDKAAYPPTMITMITTTTIAMVAVRLRARLSFERFEENMTPKPCLES
jgi:hypothetical protein